MEIFQKMNFYCCMMPIAQRILIFPTKITNILTCKNSTKVSVWQSFVSFRKRDIPILAEAFRLPDSYTCEQRTVCNGIEGLCLLLRRLAYPCRYSDLIHRFGRPVPEVCMINNHAMETVYWQPTPSPFDRMEPHFNELAFASNICWCYTKERKCFGFIDGTVRPICRPEGNQRIIYNGHKRVHGLKYQSVSVMVSLCATIFGHHTCARID